jgi:hypothetical protein
MKVWVVLSIVIPALLGGLAIGLNVALGQVDRPEDPAETAWRTAVGGPDLSGSDWQSYKAAIRATCRAETFDPLVASALFDQDDPADVRIGIEHECPSRTAEFDMVVARLTSKGEAQRDLLKLDIAQACALAMKDRNPRQVELVRAHGCAHS